MAWLGQLLTGSCPGLEFSPEKTSTASVGGEQMPLVRQSRKMERIQTAISGGFDASGGEELIQAIEALVRSQLTTNGVEESPTPPGLRARSEEHTSELPSLMRIPYAVFCLKKKKLRQQSRERYT